MKLPILEQGKLVGFYLNETPAEKAAGKRVFARPGIRKAYIEQMREEWPPAGRRRTKANLHCDSCTAGR
jgi:hypothetical protein